jgi:hypothetical protein
MPQICDMGQTASLPFRRKACSAGNEPAILGTRGQHVNHWTTEAASLVVTICINKFDKQKFYFLPTECIYRFCMVIGKNGYYIPVLNGYCNRQEQCLLHGASWVLKYRLCHSFFKHGRTVAQAIVPGLSPQRPRFDPEPIIWYLWWTKWQRDRFISQ